MLEWKVLDRFGTVHTISIKGYHVPTASVRLLSPQCVYQTFKGCKGAQDDESYYIMLPDGAVLLAPYGKANLPLLSMSKSSDPRCLWSRCFAFEDTDPKFWARSLLDAKNLNLSAAQKELLRWHNKLSHAALSTVHNLCRMKRVAKPKDESDLVAIRDGPTLPCTFNVPNACCDGLLCAACTVAKASRRAPSINSKIKPPARQMVLKDGDLQPGDCISCDHFMSPVTGRAIADSGYSSTRHGYTCGTIYVDHATGFMQARCQKSISAEDTIRGKLLFEQEAADSGVRIKKYHSDNGIFSSAQFKAHCKLMKQKLTFSGVGAKFQNGVAENAIKTVCNMARANMLHATMQWPGFSFLDLWPFAIAYAVWVHNIYPPVVQAGPLKSSGTD
jgi:transposase InsO family protein